MHLFFIKLVLAVFATLALLYAIGYITKDAQPVVIMSAWVAIWWSHNLLDGTGLRPTKRRPIMMRLVTIGIMFALGTACYRSGVSSDVVAFSIFALSFMLVMFIWLLVMERQPLTRLFKRHELDC